MTKVNTAQSSIAHAFQTLADALDLFPAAEQSAYLARVTMILAQELDDPQLFEQVLQRAKGAA